MTSIGKPEFIGSLFDRSLLASSSFSAEMVRFSISFSVRGTHLLRRSGKLLICAAQECFRVTFGCPEVASELVRDILLRDKYF